MPSASPDAITLQNRMGTSCVGQIENSTLFVVEPGSGAFKVLISDNPAFDVARVSRDGQTVVGWNLEGLSIINLLTANVQRLAPRDRTSSDFDMAADGSKVVWRGKDQSSGATALVILDRLLNKTSVVAVDGKHLSMSPDGKAVAFEQDSRIRVYMKNAIVDFEWPGTWPSWRPDSNHLAYRDVDGHYQIVDVRNGESQSVRTQGSSLGPLQWSGDGSLAMYVSRLRSDFWLAPPSCPERYSVIVGDAHGATGVRFHAGCSLYPERMQWINNSKLCLRPGS